MCGSARFLRCAPCSSHLIAKHRDGDSEKTHLEVLEPEGHIMLAISPPSLNSIQVNRTKRIFYFCCQDVNISCFCFFNAQVHGVSMYKYLLFLFALLIVGAYMLIISRNTAVHRHTFNSNSLLSPDRIRRNSATLSRGLKMFVCLQE